jgi:ACS family allantoate permease-like MFS transporter
MRWLFARRNRERDAKRAALGDAYKPHNNHEFQDLTDLQNAEFRYAL